MKSSAKSVLLRLVLNDSFPTPALRICTLRYEKFLSATCPVELFYCDSKSIEKELQRIKIEQKTSNFFFDFFGFNFSYPLKKFLSAAHNIGITTPNLIDPSINVKIPHNSNIVIGNASIGQNVSINSPTCICDDVILENDVQISDYTYIGPRSIIQKGALISPFSTLGYQCSVSPNVNIQRHTYITKANTKVEEHSESSFIVQPGYPPFTIVS